MSETFTSTAAVQQLLSATSHLADLICQGLIQKRVDRVTWFIICKGRRLRKCFNEEDEDPIEIILEVHFFFNFRIILTFDIIISGNLICSCWVVARHLLYAGNIFCPGLF